MFISSVKIVNNVLIEWFKSVYNSVTDCLRDGKQLVLIWSNVRANGFPGCLHDGRWNVLISSSVRAK